LPAIENHRFSVIIFKGLMGLALPIVVELYSKATKRSSLNLLLLKHIFMHCHAKLLYYYIVKELRNTTKLL